MGSLTRWFLTVVGAVVAGLLVNWIWNVLQPPRDPTIINNYYLPSATDGNGGSAPSAGSDPGTPIEEAPPDPPLEPYIVPMPAPEVVN